MTMRITLKHFSASICAGFTLVIATMSASALPASAGTTNDIFTRKVMLKAMAQNCIVPGIIGLSTGADALFQASQKLLDEPNEASLDAARAAWRQLQSTYASQNMLFYGPVENQTFWQENFYRRVHPQLLEYGIDGRMPIDSDAIERGGAQVKGFATAEYLLFGPVTPPQRPGGRIATNSVESWLLRGNTSMRRRQYLCEVTRNLDQQLQAAARQARDEKFPDDFASKGQTSVNLLVNELTVALETDLTLPLQDYVRIPNWQQRVARDQANETEGDSSGTTFSEMKMSLAGLRRFYSGGGGTGLKDYLQQFNPGLADRLELQFQATAAALDALDHSTQSKMLAQRPALQNTLEQTHKLEILLKVDLTSALGVTIMFNAYDGD